MRRPSVNNAGAPIVSASATNVLCNGGNDGTATVSAVLGTPPFTYVWDDPMAQTNTTATFLTANTYTATVTDAAGCIASDFVTITEPSALVLSLAPTSASSGNSDGAVDLWSYYEGGRLVQRDVSAVGLEHLSEQEEPPEVAPPHDPSPPLPKG